MITLEANYSKKLGLPGFSSHQFSITLRSEIVDVNQVQQESARLYRLLQDGVDTSIKETGYLPRANGHANGNGHDHNGVRTVSINRAPDSAVWGCSEKQKSLIQKIVVENSLNKSEVEKVAQERFGVGVKGLNKLQASSLIEELLEQTGQTKTNRRNRFQVRFQKAGAR
jgi:hypothetical protein